MILKERISIHEKYEVLSMLSPNPILFLSGFLGGVILSFLLFPLVMKGTYLFGKVMNPREVSIILCLAGGVSGMIAAKVLQWEYIINEKAHRRVAEIHVPLVYPYFLVLSFMAFAVPRLLGEEITARWFEAMTLSSDVSIWATFSVFIIALAILSSALAVIWRFWCIIWLSILSPVSWKTVVEMNRFDYRLRIAFADAKRYPAPLSLILMNVDQSGIFTGKEMRKVKDKLVHIIDNNVRETDIIGMLDKKVIVITASHTESSGAAVQAKRLKKIIEEYLNSLGKEQKITLSAGIAVYTPELKSHEELVEKTRLALRKATEQGGDRIVCL